MNWTRLACRSHRSRLEFVSKPRFDSTFPIDETRGEGDEVDTRAFASIRPLPHNRSLHSYYLCVCVCASIYHKASDSLLFEHTDGLTFTDFAIYMSSTTNTTSLTHWSMMIISTKWLHSQNVKLCLTFWCRFQATFLVYVFDIVMATYMLSTFGKSNCNI